MLQALRLEVHTEDLASSPLLLVKSDAKTGRQTRRRCVPSAWCHGFQGVPSALHDHIWQSQTNSLHSGVHSVVALAA